MNLNSLISRMPDEKLMLFTRRHPIVIVGQYLLLAVLAAIPFGIHAFFSRVWPAVLVGSLSRPTLLLMASAYYLNLWLFIVTTFIDYYLDAWVVTTHRVLNIEQSGLFSRAVSELDVSRIQDVTSEVKGVIAFIFGYGNVHIQTAGETERFMFEQVPNPEEVRKGILLVIEQDRRRKTKTE
jgi:uncharacterized membrane protein YdbT with pleckstrin-like domain